MTNEVSTELITAIELLHHLPQYKEDKQYTTIVFEVTERVGRVWGELKGLPELHLEKELHEILFHEQLSWNRTDEQMKELEMRKLGLISKVLELDPGWFSRLLLELFGIHGGENLFIPRVFQPELRYNGLLQVAKWSKKRIKQVLDGGILREEFEKIEKIDIAISKEFERLRKRLSLLQMPIHEQVHQWLQWIESVDALLESEQLIELIRTSSTLIRNNVSSISGCDALSILEEMWSIIEFKKERITKKASTVVTLWDICTEIEEHYGIKITDKNPGKAVNLRNGERTIERHLMRAAYQISPDLLSFSRLQTSIHAIKKAIREKKELSKVQMMTIEDIVDHYSQEIVRRSFDATFCRLAVLYKRPKKS